MLTDTEIKIRGLRILVESMGILEAQRFVTLLQREPFDYTKWQQTLWTERSVEDISASAMRARRSGEEAGSPE